LNNKKADQLVLKTPNMSNTFNRVFNSIKKELSEYTHVSSLEKLAKFNDLTTDYFNEYNKVIYNKFIDYINQCHIAMLTAFLAFSNNLVPDSKMEIFDKYFAFSLRYGIDEGVLNIESNKK